MRERLKRLQRAMRSRGTKALLFASSSEASPNMLYFFGEETAPAYGLVTPDCAELFTLEGRAHATKLSKWKQVEDALKKLRVKRVGLDDKASARLVFRLQKKFKPVDFSKDLLGLRLVKDEEEIRKIRTAQKTTKEVVASLPSVFGKTESHVAGLLELEARKRGFPLTAFPPIVLSGERTREPHGEPSGRKILRGDVVLLDVGVKCGHYCGDYSTTYYEGKDEGIRDAVEAVRQAQKAGARAARVGVKGKRVSDAALEVLEECGFADSSFKKKGLRVGHFIGLDVHDGVGGIEDAVLKKGMAFTVEPGVYTKNYGVRFEDVVIL